jgi:hypothetical protein
MERVTRRTFAKLSAVAAVAAVEPRLLGSRQVAGAMPRDGDASGLPERPGRRDGQDDTLRSEFLLDLTLEAQTPHETGGSGGGRLVVPVSGGTFEGPRMKGTVIGPSGDWIVERPDGSRVVDARILLQTDDAQTIYMASRGVAYTPPGGQLVARITPVFETQAPRYAWLNNVVAVGVYRGAGKIAYRIYQIL